MGKARQKRKAFKDRLAAEGITAEQYANFKKVQRELRKKNQLKKYVTDKTGTRYRQR